MGKVISVINMKGGVGKTTLTINIGNELSKKGKRVLIVDMDPQFNATQSLLLYKTRINNKKFETPSDIEIDTEIEIEEEINSSSHYKELSDNKKTVLQIFEKTNLSKANTEESLTQEIKENLYLIPGDLLLANEISGDTSNKVSALLKHFNANKLTTLFDYIFIDCPPTWSILTHSSLVASDYYVIPSKVDFYSSIGIQLLEDQIREKITNDMMYQALPKQLKRLGILFTLVHKKIKAEEDRAQNLRREFPEITFFNSDLPHMPSIPSKFVMFEEAKTSHVYTQLTNSIDRITSELEGKILEQERV